MRYTLSVVLSIFFTLLLSGCSDDSAPQTTSIDGEELYSLNCARCHKKDGSGDFLKGIPANRRTALQEKQVILLIRQGDPSRPEMPTFSNLTEQQASAIVDYLFSLKVR